MVRRLLLFSVVLAFLFGAVDTVFGDIASDLKEARTHVINREFDHAEAIYRRIATENPGTEDAFAARRALPSMYVAWDRQSEAEAAFGAMLNEFSQHERLPHAIHEIAEECYKIGRADKGRDLCETALSSRADSNLALWLQMGVAISDNYLGDEKALQSAFMKLTSEYASDRRSAEAVGQIAWSCRKLKKHRRAYEFYQYVVENWPHKDRAVFSQRGTVLCHIALGNREAAWGATEELLSSFSQDESISKVVSSVAEAYRNAGEYERARRLHQYVLDNHPDSDEAMWSQRSLAISCIELEDDPNAQVAVDTLLTKFSEHSNIARAVYQVARKMKNDENARGLFQHIIDSKPADEHAVLATANLGMIELRLGNDDAARAVFDKMLRDFSAHPILPKAIVLAADGYYDQARLEEEKGRIEQANQYYLKAIAECERVRTQFPFIPYTTPESWYFTGVCYARMGQHETALEYYRKVVNDWPKFDHAWDALFKIGRVYESLRESGAMSRSEANPKIRAAYQQLVEEYPGCNAVKAAQQWLSRHK